MKVKKVPLRKCISCGQGKPKKELIRIVKNKENEVFVDLTGKANGRGAYICASIECFEEAAKTNKLSRSLEIDISEEVFDKLKEVIED
ncbi:MAG: YlxR family protein [Tissierellia bacterium]|nr:YlxR family protein [Tissierellia bacterium]